MNREPTQLELRAVAANKQRIRVRVTQANAWQALLRAYQASGSGVLCVGVARYAHNGSPCVTDDVFAGVAHEGQQP